MAYIFRFRLALEVGFDRFVLLVELRQIGHEVLDDVGMRKRIDSRLVARVRGDST